jgi:hypothetical protein
MTRSGAGTALWRYLTIVWAWARSGVRPTAVMMSYRQLRRIDVTALGAALPRIAEVPVLQVVLELAPSADFACRAVSASSLLRSSVVFSQRLIKRS